MNRKRFEPHGGYGPEYVDQQDGYDDEMYETGDFGMSEATATEMYDWAENINEMMDEMDDEELEEFAMELMDDEFLGAIIPKILAVGKKVLSGIGGLPRFPRRPRRPRRPLPRPRPRPSTGYTINQFGRDASRDAGQFLQNLGGNIQRNGPQFFNRLGQQVDQFGRPPYNPYGPCRQSRYRR
ncbi:MAG: hypothetical protein AB8F95_04560 [Bacteroidia bacterium]